MSRPKNRNANVRRLANVRRNANVRLPGNMRRLANLRRPGNARRNVNARPNTNLRRPGNARSNSPRNINNGKTRRPCTSVSLSGKPTTRSVRRGGNQGSQCLRAPNLSGLFPDAASLPHLYRRHRRSYCRAPQGLCILLENSDPNSRV